ncbi:MAG: DUF3159 domain-containing protein [Actinobacteria bacterium]|nr:DUF3159 domain-containing protein [Actinomycetota bacterium]
MSEQPPLGATVRDSIGGVRGLFDSGFPSLVFVAAWLLTNHNLGRALTCAVVSGLVVAIVRIVRKQSLQQVLGGFVGVALSAYIAHRTHRASNFFLPGIVINAVYLVALLISVAVRRPLIAYLGGLFSENFNWREDAAHRSAAVRATWIWISIFALKLAVQVPLLKADQTAALGVARFVMGYPLFIAGGWLTWRIVRRVTTGATGATSVTNPKETPDSTEAN